MKLEDMMNKWKTVNGPNCKDCGNPWFFDKEDAFQCTTCGHEEKKIAKGNIQVNGGFDWNRDGTICNAPNVVDRWKVKQ